MEQQHSVRRNTQDKKAAVSSASPPISPIMVETFSWTKFVPFKSGRPHVDPLLRPRLTLPPARFSEMTGRLPDQISFAASKLIPVARLPRSFVMEPKKCGCGKTKNAQGNCDGSHAAPVAVAAPEPKKCGCGKTKNPKGYCDGSHAK